MTFDDYKALIESNNSTAIKKDCLKRQYCPEEIIDELFALREYVKLSIPIDIRHLIGNDDILYMYPDVICPTIELVNDIYARFYKELDDLRSRVYN